MTEGQVRWMTRLPNTRTATAYDGRASAMDDEAAKYTDSNRI